ASASSGVAGRITRPNLHFRQERLGHTVGPLLLRELLRDVESRRSARRYRALGGRTVGERRHSSMVIGVRSAAAVLAIAGLSMPAGEAAVRRERVQFLRGDHAFVMDADGSAQHRSPLPSYGYWSP